MNKDKYLFDTHAFVFWYTRVFVSKEFSRCRIISFQVLNFKISYRYVT